MLGAGYGREIFTDGTVRAYPEWWGARGDGVTDDSGAVLAAFNAAAATGAPMQLLPRHAQLSPWQAACRGWRAAGFRNGGDERIALSVSGSSVRSVRFAGGYVA